MKPKVLSILPRLRFEDSKVSFPSELAFSFEDVREEEEVIEACRGVDFLLLPAAFPQITGKNTGKHPIRSDDSKRRYRL